MKLVWKIIANMVGIWLASLIVPGITLPSSEGILQALGVLAVIAVVFTLVNMIVRPLVKLLSFPIYVLTFGLFALVVNALMFLLTGWMTAQIGFGMEVSGFWAAFLGGLVTAIIASIFGGIQESRSKK
ncbi:MAG: phage holin family protein [Actinomycetaceae bacterium]|nr:phage holin family protein [Actinomycetaceae bacterium]